MGTECCLYLGVLDKKMTHTEGERILWVKQRVRKAWLGRKLATKKQRRKRECWREKERAMKKRSRQKYGIHNYNILYLYIYIEIRVWSLYCTHTIVLTLLWCCCLIQQSLRYNIYVMIIKMKISRFDDISRQKTERV